MRWQDLRPSSNVEDRRGISGRGIAMGGGGLGVIIIALAVLLCGGDPSALFQNTGSIDSQQVQAPAANSANPAQPDENSRFARAIMGSLEDGWKQILPQQTRVRYQDPKLVLYTGQVRSACGLGDAAMGPFYCPGDMNLYLDFAFFDELKREFKAPGDFAQAYVIAHEFGHHIQNLMGTMDRLQASNAGNKGSVALELQADCYAGIWANYAASQGRLDATDPQEAIRAASAVGDDMIQKRTQGYVVPDSFTHGSSQQRVEWFARGMKTGNMANCKIFR